MNFMENHFNKERLLPRRSSELLHEFEQREELIKGEKLNFSGVDERDVYNISAPFWVGDKEYIAGRIEAREAWADSYVAFFQEKKGVWIPVSDTHRFKLEDPFTNYIGEDLVFGGVEIYPNPQAIASRGAGFRTVFYRGRDIESLTRFAAGPDMMKDIRIAQLPNGRIGVFTRPLGGMYGKGKIGYLELNSLDELQPQHLLEARIIEDQFAPDEWGGVNELHPFDDGRIGALGHIAYQDADGGKHYYAMSFVYDPQKHSTSPIKIIAARRNFPEGDAKTPELQDVVFPGGLLRDGKGAATLYAGLSDVEAGRVSLRSDPFVS
ncbi:MAG: DUF1861 family protein [Candidatus Spechtbacterales bacterium]